MAQVRGHPCRPPGTRGKSDKRKTETNRYLVERAGIKMNKRLKNKIDLFLKDRRKSLNGGWAEITKDDVALLDDIITTLIKAKCEDDADGDYATDPYFLHMKYERDLEDISKLASVSGTCADWIDKTLRIMAYRKEQEAKNVRTRNN